MSKKLADFLNFRRDLSVSRFGNALGQKILRGLVLNGENIAWQDRFALVRHSSKRAESYHAFLAAIYAVMPVPMQNAGG